MRNLAVADEASVHPHIETGIHSLKIQVYPGSLLIPVICKSTHIFAAGILVRHIRRIHGERISGISVLMAVIAIILPDSRHLYRIKGPRIISLPEKLLLYIINAGEIAEFPLSGKQHKPGRGFPAPHRVLQPFRSRNIVGSVRQGVFVKNA